MKTLHWLFAHANNSTNEHVVKAFLIIVYKHTSQFLLISLSTHLLYIKPRKKLFILCRGNEKDLIRSRVHLCRDFFFSFFSALISYCGGGTSSIMMRVTEFHPVKASAAFTPTQFPTLIPTRTVPLGILSQ